MMTRFSFFFGRGHEAVQRVVNTYPYHTRNCPLLPPRASLSRRKREPRTRFVGTGRPPGSAMIDLASYFGDVTKIGKVAFYTLMASILVVYSLIGLAAPLLRPVCTQEPGATPGDNRGPDSGVEGLQGGRDGAPNPSYRPDPCRWRRLSPSSTS